MPQTPTVFTLQGGLNLAAPAVAIPDGCCIAVANFESNIGGYRRTDGYERYNGFPSPSTATYSLLEFYNGSVAFAEGDTVTGLVSAPLARR